MKVQKQTVKSSFLKKIFIKLCRKLDFEIIDQGTLHLPVMNKHSNNNLSEIGKESLLLPMGRIKVTRPVRSLNIILRSCASVNMLSQSKKRIFRFAKKDYSLKTLTSIINSINKSEKLFKKIKLKFTIIDHNSDDKVIKQMKIFLKKQFFKSEIVRLDIERFKKNIKEINQDGNKVTTNQISNMCNINQSLNLGKDCDDLVYFVEDDYIHTENAIEEMIYTYERLSSQIGKELIMCPSDYPYLYNKVENSNIFLGHKHHWRSVSETLCTFLTSSKIINKHFKKFVSACEFEHNPFEKPFHDIYKTELCISPMPAIAVHYTNINSIYGLSPLINYKKLWKTNKI